MTVRRLKTAKQLRAGFGLGRAKFERISAVEGVTLPQDDLD